MYVVFCKIDHCIHIHWCIVMGLGHNDPWVESHMWPQQTWGQRSSRGQWPLVQVFGKKGQCILILWCIFKSNITMIAKVCDRESRRDTWFENRLVLIIMVPIFSVGKAMGRLNLLGEQINLLGLQMPTQLTCHLPPWALRTKKYFPCWEVFFFPP